MYIVYGKVTCPFCDKAKELLQQHNLEIDYRDVGDSEVKQELLNLYSEAKTVPQIFTNGVRIGGYTDLVEYLK